MKRFCVCEICNCGRHRCQRQSTALYTKCGRGCEVSEYAEKYPVYVSYQPPKSHKPKPEDKGKYERMEEMTTFRSDYIPYEVTKRPGKQRAEYKPIPGEIDLATTYKQQFGPYELEPVLLRRPKERTQGAKGKLDTIPTYKDDYRQWEISKRETPKPKSSYQPATEKFGNATTFQDDFIPRGLVPRESFKPSTAAKLSDAPFDGVTCNQLHYVPHPLEVQLVKASNEYKPSDEPFQDLTTQRRDYQGLRGQMPKSCKPEHIPLSTGAPFPSSTEFRDRFQRWASFPQRVQKLSQYKSPTEQMDLNTTTGTTFIKHHIQPLIPARPPSRSTRSSVPFQGSTTTQEDFKAWKAQRREIIRKPSEIHKSTGKMEDMSTFKAHFIPHQLQPNTSCKPLTAPLHSEEPMDEVTTYRSEFTRKKMSVCPASLEPIPGFVFEKVDDRGHRSGHFYYYFYYYYYYYYYYCTFIFYYSTTLVNYLNPLCIKMLTNYIRFNASIFSKWSFLVFLWGFPWISWFPPKVK
ncbi:Stabilizer of axonemal microtubules 2 [Bagarius yarrelli]|uniref:Stabilizer of axonemal microtubules 2 n=1 Tax=Bagarius yarrelli TaxID=175774 RepID=A0A556TSH0_BAGYA|nr:Stabilizer of axonemal microtubules 2 [Bagarius yarrelli]